MSIRNLSPLSEAKSIAIIGGSARPHSLGAIVLDNIVQGGFSGTIYAVNPHRFDYPGVGWSANIAELPEAPDLAVVVTPAETVPGIIGELGEKGARCAIVVSAGLNQANGLKQAMLDAARPYCLRIVGPNCLGFIAPRLNLNATFARTRASAGGLALLSQSGALVTAVLDWAEARSIGFSAIASVGDMADVDLGDLIDLYATDPATKAILLYVEGVHRDDLEQRHRLPPDRADGGTRMRAAGYPNARDGRAPGSARARATRPWSAGDRPDRPRRRRDGGEGDARGRRRFPRKAVREDGASGRARPRIRRSQRP